MASQGCPDDETLARVAAGDAADEERERVMLHLDGCTTCRRGLAALAALPATPADSFIGGDHANTFPELPSELLTARVPAHPRPASTAPAIPALGDRIGRYVALRVIGRGGMGIVVAAHDPELDRQVAIKLVHPRVWRAASAGARDLLRLEARAMARLVHPNVVAVHDIGTVGDQLFVAMELVSGSSLDRWLTTPPRPWPEVLAMCCEAGVGIAAAHQAGLVHRDIKPHNVLVDETGRPRIADFGLAVLGRTDPTGDDGAPAGTPAYMSPEQHQARAVSAASDQFSFCVMVYEALYRERPFAGETAAAIAVEIDHDRVRPPPARTRVPARVRRALLRGLANDPAARFPSMTALLATLAPRAKRRWRLAAAAAVLAAAAAGAGAVMLGRGGDPAVTARRTAEARAAAVWSPAIRTRLDAALATATAAHADTTRRHVVDALDRYVPTWIAARLGVVRAGRAGEQAPTAVERRLACLDRRLNEVRALVEALTAAGPAAVNAAIDGVDELTPPSVCLAPELLAVRPPPEEPRRRTRYEELSRQIDQVVALDRLGIQKQALVMAEQVLADVRAFDHPPLLAEALIVYARQLVQVGDSARALAAYREAAPAAAAAGDAYLEARAWMEMIIQTVTSGRERPPEEALVAAGAAVARAGEDPWLRRTYQRVQSAMAIAEGRNHDAEMIQRRLLLEPGLDGRTRAEVLLSIATALGEEQKFEEALPLLEQARVVAEAVYGPDHPEVALYWINLQVAQHNLGRYADALASAQKVKELAEPGTLNAALGTLYTATANGSMGNDREAIEQYDLAVAQFRALGNLRYEFDALMNLGAAHFNLDEYDEATAALARAVEIGGPVFRTQPEMLATPGALLGMMAYERNDYATATARCSVAVEQAAAGGEDHPDLNLPLICLAQATRGSGDLVGALAIAERALRNATAQPAPQARINSRLEVARALALLGRDRRRRATLIREALAISEVPEERAEIQLEFRADLK